MEDKWYPGTVQFDEFDNPFVTIGSHEAENHYESTICTIDGNDIPDPMEIAEFVCKAVNNHNDLVSKLELAQGYLTIAKELLKDGGNGTTYEIFNNASHDIKKLLKDL